MTGKRTRKRTIEDVGAYDQPHDPPQVLKTTFEPRGLGGTGWGFYAASHPTGQFD